MQIQHAHLHYHVENINVDSILPIVCEIILFEFINMQINVWSFMQNVFFYSKKAYGGALWTIQT